MERNCLITGGARGIGRATAERLARDGWNIAIGFQRDYIAAEETAEVVRTTGRQAITVRGDVSIEADIKRIFNETLEAFGTLDGLVNAAGVFYGGKVNTLHAAQIMRLMSVNVIGLILCCREAIEKMHVKHDGGCSIVNLSSIASTTGGRVGTSIYTASKGAVDAFTLNIAKEVAAKGIRVNAVRPGFTITDMTAPLHKETRSLEAVLSTVAMQRAATPNEIAAPIAWLMSPEASFVSGALIDVAGGGAVSGAGFNL